MRYFLDRMDIPPEFGIIFTTVFVIYGVMILSLLAIYILNGVAMYGMSKRRYLPNPGLGFVPFANIYRLGTLAGPIVLGKRRIKNAGLWLLILPFAFSFLVTVFQFALMVPILATLDSVSYASPDAAISKVFGTVMGLMIPYMLLMAAYIAVDYVLNASVYYQIFAQYHRDSKPIVFGILAIIVPLVGTILLMTHRNRELLPEAEAYWRHEAQAWAQRQYRAVQNQDPYAAQQYPPYTLGAPNPYTPLQSPQKPKTPPTAPYPYAPPTQQPPPSPYDSLPDPPSDDGNPPQ